MNKLPQRIDLFCRVIDNFGDIGVCWRLAQSLAQSCSVRLIVDDLNSFKKIAPAINPSLKQQGIGNIEILSWNHLPSDITAAELVIEAFACDLPEEYLKLMPSTTHCWLNLDYLSAEAWVEDFHRQPSIQANGVAKYFFFPGFTERTGGLLRLQATLDSAIARDELLAQLLTPETYRYYRDERPLLINLFCYPDAPLEALLRSIPAQQATIILIAQGVCPKLEEIAAHLNSHARIERLSFIQQRDYDRLLQAADFNLIRGEDSFVQAHWAAKPMLWHIYPQEEAYHLVKLEAWLDTIQAPDYLCTLNELWNYRSNDQRELKARDERLSDALSQSFFNEAIRSEWQTFQHHLANKLAQQPSLSEQILNFYEDSTKKS